MQIAVSSTGNSLDAEVDQRFGRCEQFIIANSDNDSFITLANPGAARQGGAGIETARVLIKYGVKAVITGYVGPNAMKVLEAGRVKVYQDAAGTVREMLDRYRQGLLEPATGANAPGKNSRGR